MSYHATAGRDKGMTMLRIGLVQHSCTINTSENLEKGLRSIRRAAGQGARLVVLPELHANPYFCQEENPDWFKLAEPIPGETSKRLASLAGELHVVIVSSLFERRGSGIYHNAAVVFEQDGTIAGKYRKMHIPNDPGYYEKFYFTPGDSGFSPVRTSVGSLGIMVCWDQWFPEAARLMALSGADLLICPTAIGWDNTDDQEEQSREIEAWRICQRAHAVANCIPLICVNRTGFEASPKGKGGIQFWGSSFAAGPQGEYLALAAADREQVLLVDIDMQAKERVRAIWPFFRDRRVDCYEKLLRR